MEKKKKILYAAAGAVILLLVMTAVISSAAKRAPEGEAAQGDTESGKEEAVSDGAGEEPEETVTTAMYIPIAGDVYLMADQDNGMVFTINFPEEIYGVDGEKITKEQLRKGNVVKLYGNGIMAESWPGQYPGITKIEVIAEGSPSDADVYQEIVDEFYQEPDPSEPPSLNLEYRTELAVVSSAVNRGGYEWSYLDTDGTSNSVAADSLHVLMWNDELLNAVKLENPLELQLYFTKEPEEVIVVRWPSELRNTEEDIPEGEPVTVAEKDGKPIIKEAEAGYVYMITAVWENGRADYGFLTVS